jgi:microcin C transport system substrate-binding protein
MRNLCLLLALGWSVAICAPATAYDYVHGLSYVEPLKYPNDFRHFDYVNPDAPKGGTVRVPENGTWDSFNGTLDKGRWPTPVHRTGEAVLLYDRLLEQAIDEPASWYGRLASGVWVSPDYRQFAFKLRKRAYWHDETPITVDDVIFTFQHLKEHGGAGARSALFELASIERISDDEVLFSTKSTSPSNPDLVFMVGQYSILPAHYWATRDPTKTTLEPPLGSGPYRIRDFQLGRNVTFERVDGYWGTDIPVNRGRYNFDVMKWDYFRDESVQLEALKGDVIDIREETVSKNWMTAYEILPTVKAGLLKRELVPLARAFGMRSATLWNLNREKFQDIRVREALQLLSEFRYTNRVLMFGFYNYAKSYFYNSRMAAQGLPSEPELELLEPWRGRIPDRVFTEAWDGNETSGFGYSREKVKRALELFKEAGWEVRDGVMTNIETGKPFTIAFVFESPFSLRAETPLMSRLNMVGIQTTARAPEYSNWLYRMRHALFDGSSQTFVPPAIPGIMLRNQLGSAAADSTGSQNWGRLRDPAVDAMIDHVMAARTAEQLYAATRALDRVLLWNFYRIPLFGDPGYRLVYWDRFGQPTTETVLQRPAWFDTWWWDRAKAGRVSRGLRSLSDVE